MKLRSEETKMKARNSPPKRTRAVLKALIRLQMAMMLVPTAVAQGSELKTVEFESQAVKRMMKYNILLPQGYRESGERYPVLYLLHGVGENYRIWSASNGAAFYAGIHDGLIVVMPDAGNSWYVDWAESKNGQKNDWEDYIVKDLVSHVDLNFRTVARREGRAISGLSMGGYGALVLGLRNPKMFVSVGSTSGYLDRARAAAANLRREPLRSPRRRTLQPALERAVQQMRHRSDPSIGIRGFSSQAERSPLGTMFASPDQADAHDPFVLIRRLPSDRLPHIYLDCGTEDSLMPFSQEFARILLENRIPFNYMQMAGEHNSDYWVQAMGHIMSVQYEVMRRALGERPSAPNP